MIQGLRRDLTRARCCTRSVRRGLGWVQFALMWLALIGFIGFGKMALARAGVELPKGDGRDWVSIEGYVNAPGPNAVPGG